MFVNSFCNSLVDSNFIRFDEPKAFTPLSEVNQEYLPKNKHFHFFEKLFVQYDFHFQQYTSFEKLKSKT